MTPMRLWNLEDHSIRRAEQMDDRLTLTLEDGTLVKISASGFLHVAVEKEQS